VFEILHAINYLVYFDSQDLAITVELTILFAANIGQLLQTPHAHHCLSILYHLNAQRQARKQHVPFLVFGMTRPGFEPLTSDLERML